VPNLVGYWPFDETVSGIAQDFSGQFNDGTHVNNPTIATSIPPMTYHGAGANQRSLQFLQSGYQSVSVNNSATLALTGSFTLAAWIYPTSPSTGHRGILAKWDAAGTNGYDMRLESPPVLAAGTLDGAGLDNISTTPRTVTEGQWTHVAATYNSTGGVLTLYVNGLPDLTVGSGIRVPTAGTAPLLIGEAQGAHGFNGNIDEVRIYNRELTATEVDLLRTGQEGPAGLFAGPQPGQIDLTWTAPTSGAPPSYSVLRGTVSGTYDTVFDNITTTNYSDTSVTPGTTYYYVVQSVSVLASDNSNQSSATAVAGTPTPPPPPRTKKLGSRHMCGCSTIMGPSWGAWGALVFAASVLILPRRKR
jgi:concanavalin A-like lectin/glucanase superfamily protein